jgi:hypothetical protein
MGGPLLEFVGGHVADKTAGTVGGFHPDHGAVSFIVGGIHSCRSIKEGLWVPE